MNRRTSHDRALLATPAGFILAISLIHAQSLTVDGFLSLYAGRWVWSHGIPSTDPFTLVGQGQPWIDQQWLAQSAYYLSWRLAGYSGVVWLCALTVTTGLTLLVVLLRTRGVSATRSAGWVVGAFLATLSSVTPRAQVFAFPLFVGLLWWLFADCRSARRRQRWLVVPLVALWGSLHGSVLLAVGLAAARCLVDAARAGREHRPKDAGLHLLLLAAVVTATMANPYGAGIWRYYPTILTSGPIADHVSEWQALDVSDINQLPLVAFAAVAAGVVGWSLLRRRRVRMDMLLLAVLTVLLLFASGRQEMWAAMAMAVLAADTCGMRERGSPHSLPLVRDSLLAAAAVMATVAAVSLLSRTDAEFEQSLPRGAVAAAADLLRTQPNSTVLGDEAVTLLLWRQRLAIGRVGYDIRYEIYTDRQLTAYFGFVNARTPVWQRLAAEYDVVLLSSGNHPALARAVTRSDEWAVVFSDATGLVARSG